MNICPCGAPCPIRPAGTPGRPAVYCSPACRGRYSRRYAAKTCKQCGVVYHGAGVDFCSKKCAGIAKAEIRFQDCRRTGRSCQVCGKTFNASYAEQRTCGRACGAVVNTASRQLSRKTWPSSKVYFAECAHCGTWFSSRLSKKTCTKQCYDRWYSAEVLNRQDHHVCVCGERVSTRRKQCDACNKASRKASRKRRKAVRRALLAGAAVVETVTLEYIAQRDKWRCHLCGRRVHRSKSSPHPLSPSLDHLIPLSMGGDHSKANIRLAHFWCNSKKHTAAMGEQLMLVG